MSSPLSLIFYLSLLYVGRITAEDRYGETFFRDCPVTRCSKRGPDIRFPFRLGTQPPFCGLKGFELSCLGEDTLIHLPFSGDYYVREIDYRNYIISMIDREETCPLQSLISLNLSSSIFNFPGTIFAVVNCTKSMIDSTQAGLIGPINCLSDDNYLVFVARPGTSMDKLPSNCGTSRTAEIMGDIEKLLETGEIIVSLNAPGICFECERQGNRCGFNSTRNETVVCFLRHRLHGSRTSLIIGISIGGAIVLLSVILVLFYKFKKSDKEKETQLKVERFLANHKSLNPTRYTYADIKKMTHRFKHKLGQGGFGSVYKGKLHNEIPVAVKMLENSKGNGEDFVNEVSTIGRIHHVNVVRLLGFCSEGTRRALIYEFMPNESLEKFIFSKEGKMIHRPLSWEKLQEIAIGIARGIEYLHQGCDQRILHFDIKPHNILLDNNFHPKISDFGLAKLCSKEQSIVSMTATRGTMGYIAPELFSRNFGTVSYKSDVYSFGMLMLEMVGGRKNIDVNVESYSQIYFPEWIYDRVIQGKELGLVVQMEGEEEIAKKLAIVALWCIQWNPTDRPSMTMVVQMLEGSLQTLKIPPKPIVSSTDTESRAT